MELFKNLSAQRSNFTYGLCVQYITHSESLTSTSSCIKYYFIIHALKITHFQIQKSNRKKIFSKSKKRCGKWSTFSTSMAMLVTFCHSIDRVGIREIWRMAIFANLFINLKSKNSANTYTITYNRSITKLRHSHVSKSKQIK